MAGTNTVIGVDWAVKLDSLRKQMAQVPGIGAKEAKALTATLSREMRAAEAASTKAAKATKDVWTKSLSDVSSAAGDAGADLEAVGDSFGKAGSEAGKLAGALDLVAPGAGEAARAVADLADVGEVAAGALKGGLIASLGPLAVAIGVATVAYYAYEAATEDAKEAEKKSAEQAELTKEAYEKLTVALRDARLEQDRLAGRITDAQAETAKAATALKDEYGPALEAAKERLDDARKAETEWADVLRNSVDVTAAEQARLEQLTAATGEAAVAYSDLQTQFKATSRVQRENIQESAAQKDATEAETEAKKAATEAERKREEALRRGAEAARKAEEASRAYSARLHDEEAAGEAVRSSYDDAIAKLNELEAADRKAGESKGETMIAAHEAALQQIGDLRTQALVAAETASARENVEAEALAASKAENAAYYDALKKYSDELLKTITDNDAKAEEAHRKYIQSVAKSAVDSAASVADTVTSIASTIQDSYGQTNDELTSRLEDDAANLTASEQRELKKRIAENKKHALEAFRIQQAAAIAAATVTGIQTVILAVKAGLEVGGPGALATSAAAGIAAGIAVAANIAEIASAAPPSFHRGMAPDEYSATLKAGEGVLSTQGVANAGGSEGVRALNNGTGGSGQIVVVNQHKHKIFDRQVSENLKAGGGLAGLAAASRSWHRSR